MTAEEKIELAEEIAGEPYEEIYTPDLEYSENNGMNIDETTGTDEYKTEPVPEGKPVPVIKFNCLFFKYNSVRRH